MSLGLLAPAALGALAALLVPLLLHLSRRSEARTVLFAAMRWLDPAPRPRARLKLDQRRLLAVRLLLLTLLGLWLARPVLWNADDRRPVVAVAPGLGLPAGTAKTGRAVWLAPGFPPMAAPAPRSCASLVSLIRELDANLPPAAPLTFIVPSILEADSERLQLSRVVRWVVAPDAPSLPAANPTKLPRLVVRYAPAFEDQVRWFRAAAAAWAPPGTPAAFEEAPAEAPLPAGSASRLVWLAPGPAPATLLSWVRSGGVALLAREAEVEQIGEWTPIWFDASGERLAEVHRFGAGRFVRVTRRLEPASLPNLLEPNFPEALAQILAPMPPPARVRAIDFAPAKAGGAGDMRSPIDLQPWFALLAALLFGLERWLATRGRIPVAS